MVKEKICFYIFLSLGMHHPSLLSIDLIHFIYFSYEVNVALDVRVESKNMIDLSSERYTFNK